MNSKTTPKDFFLHLGATIVLYTAAGALINLAFSIINYLRPDALAGYYYAGSFAWPISVLIVATPILYVLEWLIRRDYVSMPEKKDIWIRRWRIFLTLFLAVALIAGDLIALLNTYFNGEITSRFVYKVIVILLIAGAIGKYYFFSLYENWKHAKMIRQGNAWFSLILVIATIVGGFLITGSPAKQRQIRFDSQRLSDLQNIQWQIISYWQRTQKLPQELTALNDSLSGFSVPKDPETNAAYEYSQKTSTSFELCATFGLPTQDTKGRGAYGIGGSVIYPMATDYSYPGFGGDETWKHEAGRACLTRTIDPSRYPPTPSQSPKGI